MKKTLAVLGVLSALAAAPAFAHGSPDEMFKKMDTNGDGMISSEEHQAFSDKMFNDADTNHDGQLSREEVAAHHAKKHAAMKKHGKNSMPKDSVTTSHPTKDRQDQDM